MAFVRIVTCAMYAATGLNKILVEGSEWVTGNLYWRTLSLKSPRQVSLGSSRGTSTEFHHSYVDKVCCGIGNRRCNSLNHRLCPMDGSHSISDYIVFHIIPCSARRNYAGCAIQPGVLTTSTFVFTL